MPLPIPATRPAFRNCETYADYPDLASLTRRLAAWQHFTYANDLGITPADAVAVPTTTGVWTPDTDNKVVSGEAKFLCDVFLRPSLTWARAAAFHFYVRVSGSSSIGGRIVIISRNSGQRFEVPVTYANIGSGNQTAGFITAKVPATSGDILEFHLEHKGGDATSVYVDSISGWWDDFDPPVVLGMTSYDSSANGVFSTPTGSGAWDFPTFATVTDAGASDSAYLLRLLARRANQLAAANPRPIIAKWFGVGTGSVWYRARGSGQQANFAARFCYTTSASGTATIEIRVNGNLQATDTCTMNATRYWGGEVTFSAANGTFNLEIRMVGASGGTVTLVSSVVYAKAPRTFLVGGGAAPTVKFQPIADELIGSGRAILATTDAAGYSVGRRALLENMLWLSQRRGWQRVVVFDYLGPRLDTDAKYVTPTWSSTGEATLAAFRTSVTMWVNAKRVRITGRSEPAAYNLRVLSPNAITTTVVDVSGQEKRVGGPTSTRTDSTRWRTVEGELRTDGWYGYGQWVAGSNDGTTATNEAIPCGLVLEERCVSPGF